MTLIERVQALQQLATQDAPGSYSTTFPEYEYMVSVLNAAPDMLDALTMIREGDSDKLSNLVKAVELGKEFWPDDDEFETDRELLVRLQAMCVKMEAAGNE